jgi:DNA-binding transcriptional LysR family regulator
MRDLNAMAVFVQVVQSGSFLAAARHLSMPLSTVSRRVAILEADLEIKLLERSTHSLRLTDIGAVYFENCRKGIEAFDTATLIVVCPRDRNFLHDVTRILRGTVIEQKRE